MSENPEPNIPLLRKCVEWVESEATKPIEEREWDQADWRAPSDRRWLRTDADGTIARDERGESIRLIDVNPLCGTAFCLAGYACEVSALEWTDFDRQCVAMDGGAVHASLAAEKLLGIDEADADHLFRATNTAEDIRSIAERIAGERL